MQIFEFERLKYSTS